MGAKRGTRRPRPTQNEAPFNHAAPNVAAAPGHFPTESSRCRGITALTETVNHYTI